MKERSLTSRIGHSFHIFSKEEAESLSHKLLLWYDENKRTLPWRVDGARTPRGWKDDDAEDRGYAVLVSEVMLQQTRVATVVEYYVKWMTKWPTISDLARASLEEVHAAWAGLGYYSRATRLYEVAKLVIEKHGGKLPRTADQLTTFPGIGKYTAGAVASIAYGQPTSVVDGNVIRVLSRLRVVGGDSSSKPVIDHVWSLADSLLASGEGDGNVEDGHVEDADLETTNVISVSSQNSPTRRPGDFNQALMELGATLCTPTSPNCQACPLMSLCHARAAVGEGSMKTFPHIEDCNLCLPVELRSSVCSTSSGVALFPRKAPKKAAREAASLVCVVEFRDCLSEDPLLQKSRFLMKKRPPSGLLANLWEFPTLEDHALDVEGLSDKDKLEIVGKRAIEFLQRGYQLATPNISSTSPDLRFSFVEYVGHVLHKFSHIHQSYHIVHVEIAKNDFDENGNSSVEKLKSVPKARGKGESRAELKLTPTPQPPSEPSPPSFATSDSRRCWMSEEELMASGISTAMKKVFRHFLQAKGCRKGVKTCTKGGSRKRAASGEGIESKRQKSITAFFSK